MYLHGVRILEQLKLFTEGSVVSDLQKTKKYEALHELIIRAPIFKCIKNQEDFEQVIIARESKQSTGLGHGVAFAHAKTDGVKQFFIALGISPEGIDYSALDGCYVHFLLIIAHPPEQETEYLAVISMLTRLFRDHNFQKQLIKKNTNNEVEQFLREAAKKNLQYIA